MKNYPTWKWIIVLATVSLAIIFSIPTYIYQNEPENWFLENKINLGLDLQGGSYLLLEVESNVLIAEELENINGVVLQLARKEKTRISKIETNEDEIFFNFLDPSNLKNIQSQ